MSYIDGDTYIERDLVCHHNDGLANVMGSFISTELDAYDNLYKELEEKDKEIERLNNIIDELEKWLVEWKDMLDCPDFYEEGIIDCINDILIKIQELKGSDKE